MTTKKYTYDEVFEASKTYFNGDELAAKVFVDKYALQNKSGEYLELTPTDMHWRLAKEFARIELRYPNPMSEQEIFDLLDRFKYVIPQGSPMSGIGNPDQVQSLSNCFVIQGVSSEKYDSYGGILLADQEIAQIAKRRGGVGMSISGIRPKGLSTANAAKTTDGIGVFMERFSNTTREVGQGNRRGALMQTISINHPEIEVFINIKNDPTKVTGANISIQLTDEFMKAVKEDAEFTLRWPVDRTPDKASVTKVVRAKEIWNQIIYSAWFRAEPGLLFWDTVQKQTPSDIYSEEGFQSSSVNPCQPSWATLLTPNGITTMGDAKIGDVIWSGKQWTKIVNKVCTGEKDVYGFKTRAGIFYGTENHRVVSHGEKIEVKDADSIDISVGPQLECSDLSLQTIMDGLMIGDGMVHKASKRQVLLIGANDSDYFDSEIRDLIIEHKKGIKETAWQVNTSIQLEELPKTYDRQIPTRFKFGSSNIVRSFLRGLYSANGSVVGNSVTLKASSFKIIEDVQQMLSSIGIRSHYTTNKAHDNEFENGIYHCRESYDLCIGSVEGRTSFASQIGFLQKYKMEKLQKTLSVEPRKSKITYDIVEKEFFGKDLVYDITVEADEHTYWTNGLCVSNCGEIVLNFNDSCRLSVINLASYVTNPFTTEAKFDYDLFAKHVIAGQRLMDDLIDLELEQVDKILRKIENDPEPEEVKLVERNLWLKIREVAKNGRRTGLGITALGDALAMMNIKYGSKESIDVTYKIYRTLGVNAHTSSCIMAKERGPFSFFSYEKEKNHAYLKDLFKDCSPEVRQLWKNSGRRNIALTTTAPTGSLSTLTKTTSGIEPVFMLSYKRRKKINSSDKNAKIDFIDDMGDKWQEFVVYHHGVKKWMDITGETDIEKSPYWGATSAEIDWVASVDLQAAAQKSIDHSISKTCNLPKDVSQEVVADVYMRAYESGCKGFTVYRDGCRSGVLVSNDEPIKDQSGRPKEIQSVMAPKRPEKLPCEIHYAKVKGKNWVVLVGLLDGKPYEIFSGESEAISLPSKCTTGSLQKSAKGKYNLHVVIGDEEMIIKDVVKVFDNSENSWATRLVSMSMRHGVPLDMVIDQLNKDGDVFAVNKIIGRILKKYLVEGSKVRVSSKCPECSSTELYYIEGCMTCKNCSWSKCN